MSDKEKWLDGELWNFVRGAAIDLEIPLKSPAEEQLYWHMRQACGVYANVLAVECTAPAPQPDDEAKRLIHKAVMALSGEVSGRKIADALLALADLREWVELQAPRFSPVITVSHGAPPGVGPGPAVTVESLAATPQVTPCLGYPKCDGDLPGEKHEAECPAVESTSEQAPQVTPTKPTITLEVYQHDWLPGFAAFHSDGERAEGATKHIVLNLGSLLCAVESGDLPKQDLPYMIAESLMHETVHALEEWAGVEFSEERVEELLTKYRAKYARATIWEYTGPEPKEPAAVEGTSEQASPTPELCPSCFTSLRYSPSGPWEPGWKVCPNPWHSSAATQKGTTKD